jgi:hypothetical protein
MLVHHVAGSHQYPDLQPRVPSKQSGVPRQMHHGLRHDKKLGTCGADLSRVLGCRRCRVAAEKSNCRPTAACNGDAGTGPTPRAPAMPWVHAHCWHWASTDAKFWQSVKGLLLPKGAASARLLVLQASHLLTSGAEASH